MKNNTNTNLINVKELSALCIIKATDDNFRCSVERLAKLATFIITRSNWQKMIEAEHFAGVISDPQRSLEVETENKAKLDEALSKFYKAFLWLCSQCKDTLKKDLVNTKIVFDEDLLTELASALLSSEIEITRIHEEGMKHLLDAVLKK